MLSLGCHNTASILCCLCMKIRLKEKGAIVAGCLISKLVFVSIAFYCFSLYRFFIGMLIFAGRVCQALERDKCELGSGNPNCKTCGLLDIQYGFILFICSDPA